MRPLLVGEANPYGGDPDFALWPDPPYCAGWRLCHQVLRLGERQYLRLFERANLCPQSWSVRAARTGAAMIKTTRDEPLVLLGAKVCEAFGVPFDPFTYQASFLPDRGLVILPHPSGRSRAWNDPVSYAKARHLVGLVSQEYREICESSTSAV